MKFGLFVIVPVLKCSEPIKAGLTKFQFYSPVSVELYWHKNRGLLILQTTRRTAQMEHQNKFKQTYLQQRIIIILLVTIRST